MKRILIILLLISLTLSLSACSSPVTREFDPGPEAPTDNNFDVIVVGGDPEGVAAAVSASRNGMTVLLVEEAGALGGLMTLGMLNFLDMNHGKDGTLLTRGIFEEFHDAVGGNAFDVEEAKQVFLDMVENQQSIVLKLNTKFLEPIKDGNHLIGIKVEEEGEIKEYYGERFVDASIDADLAAASGVPYTFAGEDIGEKDRLMGVTLVFEVENVSWLKVFTHLNYSRVMGYVKKDERRHEGANFNAGWGYTKVGYNYEPQDDMMRLRGFNIARQDDGNVLINALLIFGVDVLDPDSKQKGIDRAKVELENLMPYIRENFTGFEKAELVGTAQQLYIRESRHIIGEYQLTIDDLLENRDQWDRIALGSYPVDVQPTATQRWGTIIGNPDRYSIPFRSLVPLEVENLLVVGRSASFKSLAAGSARVMPIGMATGEAAGVASAYSINNAISFREMTKSEEAIISIQETLIAQGAYLEPFDITDPNTEHWAYEGVRTLRSLGILDGGYDNNYRLEVSIEKWRYQNMLNNVINKSGNAEVPYLEVPENPTNADILKSISLVFANETKTAEEAREILKEKNILTAELEPYFADDQKQPQAAEVIVLVSNLYKYMTN